MSQINKNDIISDDALEAPLVLRKNFEQLLDTAKQFIGTAKQYDDSLKSSSKTSEDHRNRTKELTDEQRVLAQITKQVATESAKQSDAYSVLHTRLQELKQATKDHQTISAEEARNISLRTSSIERFSQALDRNRKAYAQLQTEQQRNSAEGRKLLSVIQEQDKALNELHPSLEKTHGKLFLISEALNKMGEGGVRVNEMLLHTAEALTSGWAVLTAGIGLGAAALKTFFTETEEGRIKMEIFEEQAITRWSIFKNKVAEATKAVLDFAEADAATKKYHQEQLVARMTPEQRKEYEKQVALDKASKDLVLARVEILEHEAEIEGELADKRHEAIEAALEAAKTNRDAADRLVDIVKANKLFNEVQVQENFLLKTRNQILIAEINLRAQGRDLRADEKKQISDLIVQYKEQQNAFDSASRRRVALEASLRKELEGKPGQFINYTKSGVENLGADRANMISGLLGQYGITANNDLNKLREDLGKKSLDELKKILEEAKKLRDVDAEKQKEQALELEHRKSEIIQEGANAAVKIVDDQFNHQIAAHEFYLEQTRENYQEEMQMANGNKLAQAQLTKEFRDRERREQHEILREKRKQAQFERDIAILTIINKTREAAAADLAKYQEAAGPFIAYDIAMGAIQEAAVLAKPLPSYDVGVDSHPGGPALVHPGELLHYNNQIAFTPDIPSVIDLPKGTQVDTQAETMRLLALAGLSYSVKSDRKEKQQIVEQLQEIKEQLRQTATNREDFHAMMAGYYSFKKESEVFSKRILIEKFGR